MNTATESDIENLRAELKQLRADFAKIADTLKSTMRHGRDDATAFVEETAEDAWEEAREAAAKFGKRIEDKPIPSALIAFGAGLIFGLLFGRR